MGKGNRAMYCILVAGMPAAGKSTVAGRIAERMKLPLFSKDRIKEQLYDGIGFRSREEKVRLGVVSMEIMYHVAEQLMGAAQPFLLENNFEHSSEAGLKVLLEKYQYPALTILLTGDRDVVYQRFLERDMGAGRHRGHVVNDCYPEKEGGAQEKKAVPLSREDYLRAVETRGFDDFSVGGEQIRVDVTDFSKLDMEALFSRILAWRERVLHGRGA